MKRINVTKTFLPPIEEYEHYLQRIWETGQLTNQGPLLQEFEEKTKDYLGVRNLHFVTNGTLALQLALQALDITEGEVITTPFSYVATVSAILWQRCKPVFVDIDSDSLCIDVQKIEAAITSKTKAIMPVHVFGHPCDVEAIELLAKKHGLKVIYDSAHAFGVKYNGKSIMSYGDISICSLHATKLFHTIEGGSLVTEDKAVSDKIELLKRFGHNGDDHRMLGINAKASEFQAAMGLCNLEYVDTIIDERKRLSTLYSESLGTTVFRPQLPEHTTYNYAYYPVVFDSEDKLLDVVKRLNADNIFPRRYFYPSLNTLPYIDDDYDCPVSEDIAVRVLCLPLYSGLEDGVVNKICEVIKQ